MLQLPTSTHVDNVISALEKKDKRYFSRRNAAVKEQVNTFSPYYRDFIYKVISNNSLKIKPTYRDSSIKDDDSDEKRVGLTKRRKNRISADIDDELALPHELGHAVDFWFGAHQALSTTVILEDDKTLYDIFAAELESDHPRLYQWLLDECRLALEEHLGKGTFDILKEGIRIYRVLLNEENPSTRKEIHKLLYENEFVEIYYELVMGCFFDPINQKYFPVIDALGSKYDLSCLGLAAHDFMYYLSRDYNDVNEFFANCFAAKVTFDFDKYEKMSKLLPRSFAAFEKLFAIFYTHIQNNKRFTDLKTKKREEKHE